MLKLKRILFYIEKQSFIKIIFILVENAEKTKKNGKQIA